MQSDMESEKHYRHYSSGLVNIYGNSIHIKEKLFNLTDEQRREWAHDDFTLKREAVNEQYELAMQEMIMLHGEDYNDEQFWRFKKIQKPPKREKGDIKGFSRSSRYRLLKKLNQLNPDNCSNYYHITLTYPKDFPTEGEIYKGDLDAFLKRVKRKFGAEIMYLWKLEFQKRGAPHYHIILYIPSDARIKFLRDWFGLNWFQVVQRYWDTKDTLHKYAGVSVDKIDNLKMAGSYLSKYISKDEDDSASAQGRYWGCSKNWGHTILEDQSLTAIQLIILRRLLKRYLKENEYMTEIISKPFELTIFGHWSFFVKALKWIKEIH